MSAYVCTTATFATLAQFAMNHGIGGVNPRAGTKRTLARVANVLGAENVRSVNYRYRGTDTFTLLTGAEVKRAARPVSLPQIVKLCDCLKYQSCETDDYETTEAAVLLAVIHDTACGCLGWPVEYERYSREPAYNAAQWGIDDVPASEAPSAPIAAPEPIAEAEPDYLSVRNHSTNCASDGVSFDMEF